LFQRGGAIKKKVGQRIGRMGGWAAGGIWGGWTARIVSVQGLHGKGKRGMGESKKKKKSLFVKWDKAAEGRKNITLASGGKKGCK